MRSWSYNRNLFNFQLLFILKYITIFLFPRDILSYTFFFNWMRYIILNKESLHKKTRSKKSCKYLGSTTKAYNTISNIWDGIFSIMMIAIFIIILGFLPRTTQKSNPQWIRIMLRLQLALSLIWYLIAGMKPWSLCYSLPKKSKLASLSIPLGQPNTEDRLTWSFVQPGTYTWSNLDSISFQAKELWLIAGNSPHKHEVWNKIWGTLTVPNKIKGSNRWCLWPL